MTSLQSGLKQIPANAGYYIPVANCVSYFVQNNGTDAAPSFGQAVSSMSTAGKGVSSLITTAGAGVFRDHGKTLLSAGRVFRKVQLLISSNSLVNGGTDGVGGSAYEVNTAAPYITGYIELPGTGGLSSGSGSFAPVARLG